MRNPEAIVLARKGINPLEYSIDPQAIPPMGRYLDVLQTACARKDLDEISHTRGFTVASISKEEGTLFTSIGETLFKSGLPCVITSLQPRHDETLPVWDYSYTATQNGTMIGGIVQNGIHSAALEYEKRYLSGYSDERRKELVDEFILRAIKHTRTTLTENGWKPLKFGVLI